MHIHLIHTTWVMVNISFGCMENVRSFINRQNTPILPYSTTLHCCNFLKSEGLWNSLAPLWYMQSIHTCFQITCKSKGWQGCSSRIFSGHPLEQPCQPSENPVHPSLVTHINPNCIQLVNKHICWQNNYITWTYMFKQNIIGCWTHYSVELDS